MEQEIMLIFLLLAVSYHVKCRNVCPCTCPDDGKKTTEAPKVSTQSNDVSQDISMRYHNVRLPKHITPIHYNVFLDVNMETKQVNGNVTIQINVFKPTSSIIIHAMEFSSIKGALYDKRNKAIFVPRQFEYKENQFYVMELEEELPADKYLLVYEYSYRLRKKLAGFYEASYRLKSGKEMFGAFTQFQPTDARGAFPCFDEPALRATFDITLGHPKKYIAISNMPVEKTWEDKTKGQTYDKFSTSPFMPTYLLAFAICQFAGTTVIAKTRSPVKMTFYAPQEQIKMVKYAVEAGSKILPFFEKYYNVSYPLPKADMIAVPDFAAGAMENWGLITYRMRALLYDEGVSSLANKASVTMYISHELAHMWFGNLVTMHWWSDLWLNEGFASYVEFLGYNAVHPSWKYEEFITVLDMARAMKLDALVTSHPVYIEVKHPSEINQIFDAISYSKGSSIIRMLDNFIGTKNFVKGLTAYLNKYSYGNAKTEDLWEELTKASRMAGDNYDVSKIMNTWVLQMGFPVIDVKKTGRFTYKLTQSRFLSDRNPDFSNEEFTSPYGYKWIVPFNYFTLRTKESSGVVKTPVKKLWLNLTDAYITIESDDAIIKGNAGQYGYFRVNYDEEGWKRIISLLKRDHKAFEVKDRVGLLQDAFALAGSGRLDYSTAFELLDYIHEETDYLPWKAAADSLKYVSYMLSQRKKTHQLYKKLMKDKVSKLYEKYKFKDVSVFRERYLQILIVHLACANGHEGCVAMVTQLFDQWRNGYRIPSDFQGLVIVSGIMNGGEEEWDFVFKQYLRTNVPSFRVLLLKSLCTTQQPRLIERLLHYSLNSSIIKTQDVYYIYSTIPKYSHHGRYHAWYFMKENWEKIVTRFGEQWPTMKYLVGGVVSGFSTMEAWNQVNDFFTNERLQKAKQIKRPLKQALEKIKSSHEWLVANEKIISNWLKAKDAKVSSE